MRRWNTGRITHDTSLRLARLHRGSLQPADREGEGRHRSCWQLDLDPVKGRVILLEPQYPGVWLPRARGLEMRATLQTTVKASE